MKHLYRVKRKVIKGKKVARTFSFPTANLKYYKRDKKLENGVYVANLKVGKVGSNKFNGLAFVGKSKVFKDKEKRIEIFIFKYKGNLYNKVIEVNFLKRIRGIKKFNNLKELKQEIRKDIKKAEKFLNFTF